jgi:hypothetical protein
MAAHFAAIAGSAMAFGSGFMRFLHIFHDRFEDHLPLRQASI